MLPAMVAESPFDQIAERYDVDWTNNASGAEQRKAVWRAIDPLFQNLETVLDVGCGTGADAVHLQALGVSTYGIDASAQMVSRARARGVNAHQLSIDQLSRLSLRFDGALSNFGVLNCLPSLAPVAVALRRLVRSGGPVAICIMGSACLWESIYYAARLDFRKALRRLNGVASSSLGITVRYPSHDAIVSAFHSGFRLRQFQGIGFCVPPSYVPVSDTLARRAAAADRHIAHRSPFRSLADHRLYIFERI